MLRAMGTEFRDKKIVIFGLARSGAGAANLLASLGADVVVTDRKSGEELSGVVNSLLPSIKLSLGGHPEGIFRDVDLVVVSPGVPLDIKPLKDAMEKGIKVIGELELAYHVISGRQSAFSPQPRFLAVTGTNGKSTTTTLLDLMMKRGGFKTILGGNIGNALTEEIYKITCESGNQITNEISGLDYFVVEVSSFQLESIEEFRPKGATILNITPDHLDRYHSMAEYRDAKATIFMNQAEGDFIVLNADDPEVIKVKKEKLEAGIKKPDIYYFSRQTEVKGVYFKNNIVYCNIPQPGFPAPPFRLISADEIKIKGVHNLENAMAASAMALLAKCPHEAVVSVLREFSGLEHRLEFVRELDGVTYINDSKGTNVGAVVKSLESFSEPVILIAGGRDKAGDFSVLSPLIKSRVKALILIGEAKEKINKVLSGLTATVFADDFKEAVNLARRHASRGDVILLSPACASFDMFMDFEDRGRQFKTIVRSLN